MGVVLGAIAAVVGIGLASNFRGIADRFADYGAARARPPSWLRGYTANAGTIRLIGGVFLAIGVFAIGVAIKEMYQ